MWKKYIVLAVSPSLDDEVLFQPVNVLSGVWRFIYVIILPNPRTLLAILNGKL